MPGLVDSFKNLLSSPSPHFLETSGYCSNVPPVENCCPPARQNRQRKQDLGVLLQQLEQLQTRLELLPVQTRPKSKAFLLQKFGALPSTNSTCTVNAGEAALWTENDVPNDAGQHPPAYTPAQETTYQRCLALSSTVQGSHLLSKLSKLSRQRTPNKSLRTDSQLETHKRVSRIEGEVKPLHRNALGESRHTVAAVEVSSGSPSAHHLLKVLRGPQNAFEQPVEIRNTPCKLGAAGNNRPGTPQHFQHSQDQVDQSQHTRTPNVCWNESNSSKDSLISPENMYLEDSAVKYPKHVSLQTCCTVDDVGGHQTSLLYHDTTSRNPMIDRIGQVDHSKHISKLAFAGFDSSVVPNRGTLKHVASDRQIRPTQAMLKQQAAWGTLADLSLGKVLSSKRALLNEGTTQDNQENLPSPIALGKTFMTLGEPPNRSTAYPDHAVSAASAYLGVSRPRIDSAQTIVNRETSTSQQMHRMQSEGQVFSKVDGVQWKRNFLQKNQSTEPEEASPVPSQLSALPAETRHAAGLLDPKGYLSMPAARDFSTVFFHPKFERFRKVGRHCGIWNLTNSKPAMDSMNGQTQMTDPEMQSIDSRTTTSDVSHLRYLDSLPGFFHQPSVSTYAMDPSAASQRKNKEELPQTDWQLVHLKNRNCSVDGHSETNDAQFPETRACAAIKDSSLPVLPTNSHWCTSQKRQVSTTQLSNPEATLKHCVGENSLYIYSPASSKSLCNRALPPISQCKNRWQA